MNRRERRRTSRRLGIMEYQKNLSRNRRFGLIRENIISGKKLQEENQEKLRLSLQEQDQDRESKIINSLISEIKKNKNILIEEATVEAKKEYNKRYKKV